MNENLQHVVRRLDFLLNELLYDEYTGYDQMTRTEQNTVTKEVLLKLLARLQNP